MAIGKAVSGTLGVAPFCVSTVYVFHGVGNIRCYAGVDIERRIVGAGLRIDLTAICTGLPMRETQIACCPRFVGDAAGRVKIPACTYGNGLVPPRHRVVEVASKI